MTETVTLEERMTGYLKNLGLEMRHATAVIEQFKATEVGKTLPWSEGGHANSHDFIRDLQEALRAEASFWIEKNNCVDDSLRVVFLEDDGLPAPREIAHHRVAKHIAVAALH